MDGDIQEPQENVCFLAVYFEPHVDPRDEEKYADENGEHETSEKHNGEHFNLVLVVGAHGLDGWEDTVHEVVVEDVDVNATIHFQELIYFGVEVQERIPNTHLLHFISADVDAHLFVGV